VDLDGRTAALQFFTGFVLEKSLSLDNIFVIALIFAYFRIPLAYQHRVLFWGILGALVLRGIMIGAGAALIHRFDWMVYVCGGVLLFTAVRLLVARHDNLEPEKSPVVRIERRLYPVTNDLRGARFLVRMDGQRAMTPLFLVLLLVEATDVLFAVDSIPAIFAVTTDPFVVFTSNIFAILGLRSLYFALAPLMDRFRYPKKESRVRPGVRRHEDDRVAPLAGSDTHLPFRHRGDPRHRRRRFVRAGEAGDGAASFAGRPRARGAGRCVPRGCTKDAGARARLDGSADRSGASCPPRPGPSGDRPGAGHPGHGVRLGAPPAQAAQG
jgi:predicted tellurium resistance membrane protein TerC